MSRITTPASIEASPTQSQPLLEAVKKMLGSALNMFRVVGSSPAALNTLTSYVNSVAGTEIDFPAVTALGS